MANNRRRLSEDLAKSLQISGEFLVNLSFKIQAKLNTNSAKKQHFIW